MQYVQQAFFCLQVVEAAQTAVLAIAPLLDFARLHDELLLSLEKMMESHEHEIRSAIIQLYAKLGPALQDCQGNLLQEVLMPKLLEAAEDMDFQVRRVRAVSPWPKLI